MHLNRVGNGRKAASRESAVGKMENEPEALSLRAGRGLFKARRSMAMGMGAVAKQPDKAPFQKSPIYVISDFAPAAIQTWQQKEKGGGKVHPRWLDRDQNGHDEGLKDDD